MISQPLAGNQRNGRRYFTSRNKFAKLYHKAGAKLNAEAIVRAADFLANPPPGYHWAPRLYAVGESYAESWLVCERLAGVRLVDLILHGRPYDEHKVLIDVLQQLCVLERAGLWHNDVRVWNVLIDPTGGARLMDYDAIGPTKADCVWPHDVFLAFWIFTYEVLTHQVESDKPLRRPFLSPHHLPSAYVGWAQEFWALPPAQWSFAALLESLESGAADGAALTAQMIWQQAVESHLVLTLDAISEMDARLRCTEKLGGNHEWQEQQIIALLNSASWRCTAPLRMISRCIRAVFRLFRPSAKSKRKKYNSVIYALRARYAAAISRPLLRNGVSRKR